MGKAQKHTTMRERKMKRLGSKAAKQSQVKANMQRSATSAEDVEHAMAAAAATEGGKHWKKKKRELEKKEKARVVDAVAARKKTAQALAHATATEKAEPLQRSFWPQGDDGQHDQGAPSEKLKRMRQSIGVRVSTGGGSCPAPLGALGLTDARLPDVFRGVFSAAGLTSPTPVQRQAWPALLHGLDCLVVAPTGSGKTLAYLLPIVPHVLAQRRPQPGEGPLAVILVPTRELAQQVARAALPLRKLCGLRCVALYGGLLRHERQAQVVDLLEHSTHIVVATPGRLADLASEKALEADPGEPSTTGSEVGNNTTSTSSTKQDAVLPLGRVSFLVLDEADRMLTMGFETQLAAIAQECRADRVTCCFSATFPQALRLQADALLRHPCVTVRVAAADVVAPEAGDFALTSAAAAAAAAPEEEENSAFGGDSVVSQNNHTGGSSSSSSCNMLGSVAMSSAVAHVVAVLPAPHAKPGALLKYLVAVSGPRKLCPSVLVFCNRAPVAEALAAFLAMQPRDPPPPPPPPPPSSSSLEEAATPTTSEPNHKSSPAADLGSSSSSGTTGDDTASSEAGAVDPKKAPKGEAWEYDDVEGPLVDGTAGLTADARRAARMRANSGGRGSQRYGRALPSSGGSSSDGRRAWLRVGILHGGMPQKQRDEALRDLSSGKLQVLVATDLASRGLHVPNLDHVVNYDVPHEGRVADAYPHRAGRTGRRGRPGTCLTLVAPAIALLAAAVGEEGVKRGNPADAAAQAKVAAEAALTGAVADMVSGGVDAEDATTLCSASANSDGSCLELAQLLQETKVPLGDGFGGLVSHLEDARTAAAKEQVSKGNKRRGARDDEAGQDSDDNDDDDDASDGSGDEDSGSSQLNEPLTWTRAEFREELVAFYSEVAPTKLSDVDRLVAKCWGNATPGEEEKRGEHQPGHSSPSSHQKGKRTKVEKAPREEEEVKPLVDPNEVLAALRLKYR